MARRLQDAEFAAHFQFGFRRPTPPSSSSSVPHGVAPPYFFQTNTNTNNNTTTNPSSAADAPRAPPTTGIPDRQRTPYAYVRENDAPARAAAAAAHAQAHMEHMARVAAEASANSAARAARARAERAAEAHAHAAHAARRGHPMENMESMMFETFGSLFPGAPPPPSRTGRFGSRSRTTNTAPNPNTMPDPMAEMLRHFPPDMPSFFHGHPGGEGGMGGSFGSIFMGGGPASSGEVPQFFRAMMGGAGGSYEEFLEMIERQGNVNRGANEREIANLPTVTFKPPKSAPQTTQAGEAAGVSEGEKCVICLGEYEEGDVLVVLPCKHRYHKECGAKWLKVNRTCPSCKRSIRPGDTPEQ